MLTQPPALTVAAQASYTENNDPLPISPNLSLTDADSQTMVGARVQITSLSAGIVNPCELQFTPIGNITGSYDQLTHVLTLTGVDSVANYQAALASVSFDIASDNPTYFDKHLTHTVAWQVDDGAGFDNLSKVATTTIAIHATNDAPLIGGVTAPSDYTENGAPVFLAANLALMDPDSQTLAGATVKITDGLMPCDQLKAPTIDDIRVSYDDETGVLTLSGVASVASYQKVLAALTFEHAPDDEYGGGDNPTNFGQNPTRTITLQVDDGAGFDNLSNTATTTPTIHATNDPPPPAADASPADPRKNVAPASS